MYLFKMVSVKLSSSCIGKSSVCGLLHNLLSSLFVCFLMTMRAQFGKNQTNPFHV